MRRAVLVSLLFVFSCHPSPTETAARIAPILAAAAPSPPEEPPRSPERLAQLLAEYDRADEAARGQMRASIDRVAAQRDAHVSRLYWYTDLEEAKAEARRSGRPILSLRLLGRLDEELSCANSRFFRIALYSNEKVSRMLRETYVLHWSSERPAPLVTLDLGDGRVVTRTITGNSAHYVLDSRGRVVDALPGLFGPQQFEQLLRASLDLARSSGAMTDEEMTKAVTKHHRQELWRATVAWRKHVGATFQGYTDYRTEMQLPSPVKLGAPHPLWGSLPAATVNMLTASKGQTEAAVLSLLQPEVRTSADFEAWQQLAATFPKEHLDAQSLALVRAKAPRDWSLADAPAAEGDRLAKIVAAFEKRMREDGVRSEFIFHGAVHARFARTPSLDFASTNEWLYARVFMTSRKDAWLGLVPTDALSGIADDGLVVR